MGDAANILLVDGEHGGALLEAALIAAGYRVRVVQTVAEAVSAIVNAMPDAIVVADRPTPRVFIGQDVVAPPGNPHITERAPGDAGAHAIVELVRRRLEEAHGAGSSSESGSVDSPLTSISKGNILSTLTSETVRIQEEERRKLSLELHDDVAQIMGNLVLMIGTCMDVAPPDAVQLRHYLRDARETAKEGFRRVQRFSIDLRPPMLDDLGLAPTIIWYAERFTRETDIPVEVDLPDHMPALTGEQETALFRIVQQALQNIRQHAHASLVDITVELRSGRLRLTITDNGIGITQQEMDRKLSEGTHLGLAGMRYRAELLGGKLDFASDPGQGTTIAVEIPLRGATYPGT
jgi:signal transduction histidine kinase